MRRWSARSWIEDEVMDLMSVYANTRRQALEFIGDMLAENQYEELTPARAAQVGQVLWGMMGPRRVQRSRP